MDTLHKEDLKNELIEISNALDKMAGKLMSPGCADEETGEKRNQAYQALLKCHTELKKIWWYIY